MSETYPEILSADRLMPVVEADANGHGEPSRSARIKGILDQRKPYLGQVRAMRKQLSELLTTLTTMKARVPEMLGLTSGLDLSAEDFSFDELKRIDFDGLMARTREELGVLEKLESRFGRATLNVAVVGKARQGKSLLLRKLSGLGADVIPERPGDPCTGVRSTVVHDSDGPTRGEVNYHTHESLLEIIRKYWEVLAFPDPPPSLTTFLNERLPDLPPRIGREAMDQRLYEELRKYHTHLRPLLPKLGSVEEIEEGEIVRYVTQPGEKQQGGEAYIYLAVREVKIFCDFRHEGVEGVGLIDLPGLGEATLGGPERVIRTLELDADVALFVWLPSNNDYIGTDILNLYDTGTNALRERLPLERWAYLVLNERRDDNLDNHDDCLRIERKFREPSQMKFFGVSVCNCSSAEQVSSLVLEPVLDYMSAQIGALDRDFARSSFESIRRLRLDISQALQLARGVLGTSGETLEARRFEGCFDRTWVELAAGINGLVEELEINSEFSDEEFKGLVDSVLGDYEKSHWMPDEETVRRLCAAKNGFGAAYDLFRNLIRSEMSARLRRLDVGLDESVSAVKASVARIFLKQGRFAHLVEGEPSLRALAERIPPGFGIIRDAIAYLDGFRLSARGVVGFKIRSALHPLEPMRRAAPAPVEATPDRIIEELKALVEETLRNVREALAQEEFRRPKECAYAIVADFRDAVIFTREIESEWRLFYNSVRAQVWPEEFHSLVEVRQRRDELLELVRQAEAVNQNVLGAFVL